MPIPPCNGGKAAFWNFNVLLELIEKYRNIITSWEIQAYDQDGPNFRLKAQVLFHDGSLLHIKQIVLGETAFKYAYHWQSKTGILLCRWDNAPHWPNIATYPHHKHMLRENSETVIESLGGDLSLVFAEIAAMSPSNADRQGERSEGG